MAERLRSAPVEQRSCPFCAPADILVENLLAYALLDTSPVSPGHVLIIPVRHVAGFFDITLSELQAIWSLALEAKELISGRFRPGGFNLGVNIDEAGGQTIGHAHLHLIPRYRGDVPEARGGVRAVIPGKQQYE